MPRIRLSGTDGAPLGAHDMQCRRCEAETRAGAQCRLRVCYGLPYCWRHTRSILRVRICNSRFGGGLFAWHPPEQEADGRYVVRDFAGHVVRRQAREPPVFTRGQVVVPYTHVPVYRPVPGRDGDPGPRMRTASGLPRLITEVMTVQQQDARYGDGATAPYVLEGRGGRAYDALLERSIGSLANDARGAGRPQNAEYRLLEDAPHRRYVTGADGAMVLVATKPIKHDDEVLVSYGRGYWEGDTVGLRTSPRRRYSCNL